MEACEGVLGVICEGKQEWCPRRLEHKVANGLTVQAE